MDIYTLVGNFWEEDMRAHFTPNATRLYFFLVNEANKRFWKGPLYLTWSYLQGALGIHRDTLSRAISDLKSRGLIEYKKIKGKSTFWFPQLDNPTTGPTKNKTTMLTKLDNPTTGPTTNPTTGPTAEYINNKYIIQEYKNTKDNKESNKEFPNGNSVTPVTNNPPKWYLNLDERKKDIVDTWRTLIGPFDPKWLPMVDKTLQACYPAQIKNAIVTLAKTKAEVMQEQGFEYVMEPLLRGAFGRRSKKKKQTPTGFASKLTGLKQFLEEGGDDA
ncbi:CRP/FNR family transcriptional regulator [Thermosipho africanus H17ap60334]|uniref:helix-turn-helix domain-containing protein n=1 Tax=Thermosipho africanus TaxID=2421 RepID=UPI00028E766E|nr:helix-turn-helix domain-containing protein [Thermosipho africanus]EKF49508.1 CRP/FNR family transcriptional regulator [Thermosipho africanus H17ap60334]